MKSPDSDGGGCRRAPDTLFAKLPPSIEEKTPTCDCHYLARGRCDDRDKLGYGRMVKKLRVALRSSSSSPNACANPGHHETAKSARVATASPQDAALARDEMEPEVPTNYFPWLPVLLQAQNDELEAMALLWLPMNEVEGDDRWYHEVEYVLSSHMNRSTAI
ncbi:Aste57867_5679 [Aphanomyces stellatus]|uniref:Aste57867_2465 protein n=1 Tax=Aphanomyces stellatus TaxID=120398 RepID=A0A485KDR6_9STRA|nr:hypothetical protein As57867_005666 [Aphanomyces stellatus]KAF0717150.1 hypothetical protein As57867_002459 [Aphanomyces stellatus]VFT79665.1 Aste57867_2465 [Aphanomyces stellatus]VFT82719.1 Aste57867_5679 [Aphanomyces stellatus]